MPIAIARFRQTGRFLGVKMRSFWREWTKNPELMGLTNGQKSRWFYNKSIMQWLSLMI